MPPTMMRSLLGFKDFILSEGGTPPVSKDLATKSVNAHPRGRHQQSLAVTQTECHRVCETASDVESRSATPAFTEVSARSFDSARVGAALRIKRFPPPHHL